MINKMDKSWRCCVFGLVTVFAALFSVSVAEIDSKSVCVGDSVSLFQNITAASFKITVTLYKTAAERREAIASWSLNASGNYPLILEKYRSKVLLENGTIMLRNFQSSDEANYTIVYDIAGWSEKKEAKIRALAPPSKPCKPKLRQEENFLIALLDNPDYCGKPAVSVHWMDYPGISLKDKAVLELQRGNEACTYYACIEGEALTCARKSSERDYCEYITVGSSSKDITPAPSSEMPQSTTIIKVIVVILSLVLFIVIVILIILWKHFKIVPKCLRRVHSETQEETFTNCESETALSETDGLAENQNTEEDTTLSY